MQIVFEPAARVELREALVWYLEVAGIRQAEAFEQVIRRQTHTTHPASLHGDTSRKQYPRTAVADVPLYRLLPRRAGHHSRVGGGASAPQAGVLAAVQIIRNHQ
jgi:hypothetical protein